MPQFQGNCDAQILLHAQERQENTRAKSNVGENIVHLDGQYITLQTIGGEDQNPMVKGRDTALAYNSTP